MQFIAFVLIAVILLAVFAIPVFFKLRRKTKNVEDLRNKGVAIEIELDKCRLLAGEVYEDTTPEGFPTQVEMMDALGPDRGKGGAELSKSFQLVYDYEDADGVKYKFASPTIYLDGVTLRYRIMNHPTTKIYIDPVNKSRYYFDINFLQ